MTPLLPPILGSRPCPCCAVDGTPTGTDADGVAPCRACQGTGWFPYPWNLPEDGSAFGRAPFTAEESAIVAAAPSNLLAYCGYLAVFGPVRSYRSVKDHRRWRSHHPDWSAAWSERAEEVLEECRTAREAIERIADEFPDCQASDAAIARKWARVRAEAAGRSP